MSQGENNRALVLEEIYKVILPAMERQEIRDTPQARLGFLKIFVDELLQEEISDNLVPVLVAIDEISRLKMLLALTN